ncbi:uncharacterized protein LY89DRAFT_473498 [Mollisia scopiformis]|uniref:Uncharacterized protein n=1 Tax=Mollisia scopiformis TaxID=149040 RepID=A0A194XJ54_MOLSC|nr:uncharacterized protein LY89DRAFT_473498 [Mollisia scopiformis]KUJ20193.1 hypothetical protein LY89DRAFT_473498 [Mollisia scopiformis]
MHRKVMYNTQTRSTVAGGPDSDDMHCLNSEPDIPVRRIHNPRDLGDQKIIETRVMSQPGKEKEKKPHAGVETPAFIAVALKKRVYNLRQEALKKRSGGDCLAHRAVGCWVSSQPHMQHFGQCLLIRESCSEEKCRCMMQCSSASLSLRWNDTGKIAVQSHENPASWDVTHQSPPATPPTP